MYYQKYLNKKVSKKGSNIQFEYSKIEVLKYKSILKKLTLMLDAEESYTESQWQEELLQIILLLYPKYIYLFKEVPVRDTYSNKDSISCSMISSETKLLIYKFIFIKRN
jgi:hypothetical protein